MADYWIIQAVITVLIPIFTSQLEKSREATDAANIRAEYAELMTAVLTGDYDSTKDAKKYVITLNQQTSDWQNDEDKKGLEKAGMTLSGTPKKGGTATLTYAASESGATDGKVTVTFSE